MGDYYRHWTRRLIYTYPVKMLADAKGAHWLIDAISSYQPQLAKEGFQLWTLSVNADKSATLTMQPDSDKPAMVTQELEFTDYPDKEVTFYVCLDEMGPILMIPDDY